MSRKVYEEIANLLIARMNCEESGNFEWLYRHTERLKAIVKNTGPSGSGIDSGTTFDWARSAPNKLVFATSFHHMDDGGVYDGWTEHTVTVRPSLAFGIDITIGGRDRNQIKEYLHDVFSQWLGATVNAELVTA